MNVEMCKLLLPVVYYAARALPNVHNVMSELVNVKQWNTLAHNLCLPPQEIVTINYQAHVAIVNLWFQMFGPTWNTLANALDNSGEHETAANIRSKYMWLVSGH